MPKCGREIVSDFFLFVKKALYEVKAGVLQLSFNHFRYSSTWETIETKIDPEICSILIF